MSAFTLTSTSAHTATLRHYGKLASVGYSQDMEIDQDLPRQPPPRPHSDPMDTNLDSTLPPQQSHSAATEPAHKIPPKPPVPQDAPPTAGQEGAPEQGPMAHKPSRVPHLQQDLLTLFGLDSLAATVARTDPSTGEKINKMRKSYEGKVKGFGLAGRNRAVKHDHEKNPVGLLQMVQWPAEEWHSQNVHGKDVHNGLSQATMQKLGLAMQMQPGPVPNTTEHDWEDLLGNEKTKPLPTIDERVKKPMRPDAGVKVNGQANGIRPQTGKVPLNEANRPKRAGKKRRYDDHSFEGYGEGFLDDDGDVVIDLGANSSDDGSRKGSAPKRRKKEYASATPPAMGDRRGSYGIGMLGVGSGIGAYGR
ncbi:hypothetical protein XANCAGTX0491_008635 [Xanthoria calcicola]